MLQLLQPIWLSALTALAIPVVIHLWNKTPGKILRIGSTALLQELPSRRKKSLLLSEKLLLLLRCLLLASIAFALCNPQWIYTPAAGKGWVLLPRQNLGPTYQQFRREISQLLSDGNSLRYLEEGFPGSQLSDTTGNSVFRSDDSSSYRLSITALNHRVDAAFPVYVFTDDWLSHFRGPRQPVALNLHWKTWHPLPQDKTPLPDSLTIAVYTKHYPADARYLSAALAASNESGLGHFRILETSEAKNIPQKCDWLFWLEEDTNQLPGARNIVSYAAGNVIHLSSHLLPGATSWSVPIDLRRRIAAPTTDSALAIWNDGFGHSLLSKSLSAASVHYRLFTRFNPEWNGLVWSSSFPAIVLELIHRDAGNTGIYYPSGIGVDSSQVMPPQSNSSKQLAASAAALPLTPFCWMLSFALLFAERLLSFYQHKRRSNG